MLPLYVSSLLLGLGVLVVQVSVGHDSGGGQDLHHGDAGHELTLTSIVASVRFWAFTLLAFGLVGTLLSGFGLATRFVALAIAAVAGVSSGVFAVTVVSRLIHRSPQSLGSHSEVRGLVGRIVVPITASGPGKVRVELKGNAVDLIARAPEAIDFGEPVVIEEMAADGVAQVSRAPREIAP